MIDEPDSEDTAAIQRLAIAQALDSIVAAAQQFDALDLDDVLPEPAWDAEWR